MSGLLMVHPRDQMRMSLEHKTIISILLRLKEGELEPS